MKLGVFILGGIILIASGILQVVVRPRAANEKAPARFVNGATVRAVMFVTVGVLAILVGTGVIPLASLKF
jgi:hypothetical protein